MCIRDSLVQILLIQGRDVGVEGGRATVIAWAVTYAAGRHGQFCRRTRLAVVQCLLGQGGIGAGEARDVAQLAFDPMRFLARCGLQVIEGGLTQV